MAKKKMSQAQRARSHAGANGKERTQKGKQSGNRKQSKPPRSGKPMQAQITAPRSFQGPKARKTEDFPVDTTKADVWDLVAPLPLSREDDLYALTHNPPQMKDFQEAVAGRMLAKEPVEVQKQLAIELADPQFIRDDSGARTPYLGPLYERMTPVEEIFLEHNPEWYDAVVSSGAHARGRSKLDDSVADAVLRAMSQWWNTGKTPRPPRPFDTPASGASVDNGMAASGNDGKGTNAFWGDLIKGAIEISLKMLPMILAATAGGA